MLDRLPSSRIIFLLTFIGCTSMMGIALYMEHAMNLEPCPLCIMQRVMVIAVGAIALIAAIHNPQHNGIKVYGAGLTMFSLGGAGLAGRQLWLQSLPADEVPACGPSLDYLMDVFPLAEVLSLVLSGDGTCAEVVWTFLGISIPGWTLVGLIGLMAIGVLQIVQPR